MSYKKNSLKYFMIKWDDGYSLPIFNEYIVKAHSIKYAVKQFRKVNPHAKIERKYCLCDAFSTQEIIDNQSTLSSIDYEIYDTNESLAYDSLDEHERNSLEEKLKQLYEWQEEEVKKENSINDYLSKKNYHAI